MTATAPGPGRTAGSGGETPSDAWAQRTQQAEAMIDRAVDTARAAAARMAARAREEAEDIWAEAAQRRHDGPAPG